MKLVQVKPSELIGMVDYPPLHSPEALAMYYDLFRKGEEIQPNLVTSVSVAIGFFSRFPERYAKFKPVLEKFLQTHNVKYFMLGGKHRGAAAFCTGKTMNAIVIDTAEDNTQGLKLQTEGFLKGVLSLRKTIDETLKTLEEHYFEHRTFWTMEEKCQEMIAGGDIPKYMLSD